MIGMRIHSQACFLQSVQDVHFLGTQNVIELTPVSYTNGLKYEAN